MADNAFAVVDQDKTIEEQGKVEAYDSPEEALWRYKYKSYEPMTSPEVVSLNGDWEYPVDEKTTEEEVRVAHIEYLERTMPF